MSALDDLRALLPAGRLEATERYQSGSRSRHLKASWALEDEADDMRDELAAIAVEALTEAERVAMAAARISEDKEMAEDKLAAAIAAKEEAEEALVRVQQCHIYRLPVVAKDKSTGEVGVHFIDGCDVAEVMQAVRNPDPFQTYESVDWTTDCSREEPRP
jgi:hypothetical protein